MSVKNIGSVMTIGLLLASQSFASKTLEFEDGTKIQTQATGYLVEYKDEKFDFQSTGKVFENQVTKEIVEEFIGNATNNREDLSFAEARFPQGAHSPAHKHFLGEEFYYVVKGSKKAFTTVGDKVIAMKTGSFIRIPKTIAHHIENASRKEVRVLVACEPAWTFADHNLIAE